MDSIIETPEKDILKELENLKERDLIKPIMLEKVLIRLMYGVTDPRVIVKLRYSSLFFNQNILKMKGNYCEWKWFFVFSC